MRISDWSSDVCSADLGGAHALSGSPCPAGHPAVRRWRRAYRLPSPAIGDDNRDRRKVTAVARACDALPMSEGFQTIGYAARIAFVVELAERLHAYGTTAQRLEGALILVSQKLGLDCEPIANPTGQIGRAEERRVGKECVSTCRSRWSPDT